MEYTEGEWEVGKTPPLSNWVVGVDLKDPMKMDVVANLYANEADAHLIASAPDLYEACKEAENFFILMKAYIPAHGNTLKLLQEALAKAEGK